MDDENVDDVKVGGSGSGLLQYFWDVASLNSKERIDAARKIIEHHKGAVEYAAELEYTVKRLVRGLASSREGARHGFAVALTGLLQQCDCIPTEKVREYMAVEYKTSGCLKAQEEGDNYFGGVFAVSCLVRSGRIGETEPKVAADIIEELVELASKKSFLRHICFEVIADMSCLLSKNSFCSLAFPILKPHFDSIDKLTPEGLSVLLAVERLGYIALKKKLPKWGKASSLLDPSIIKRVLPVLKSSTIFSRGNVHPVWIRLFDYILEKNDEKLFKELWDITVDDALLTSSHERKNLAFKLFELYIAKVDSSLVKHLFSKNFVHAIGLNAGNDTCRLHLSALRCIKSLSSLSNIGGDKLQALTEAILKHDLIRYVKGIKRLFLNVNEAEKKNVVLFLVKLFRKLSEKNELDETSSWILEMLVSTIKVPKHSSDGVDEDSRVLALQFLTVNGFFTSKVTNVSIDDKSSFSKYFISMDASLRELCKTKLLSLITELFDSRLVKDGSSSGWSPSQKCWLSYVLNMFRIAAPDKIELREQATTVQLDAIRQRMMYLADICARMEIDAEEDVIKRLRGMQLLLLCIGFLTVVDPIETDELADDVEQCLVEMFPSTSDSVSGHSNEEESEQESDEDSENEDDDSEGSGDEEDEGMDVEESPVNVLVDVIISLLHRPYAFLRQISISVFVPYTTILSKHVVSLITAPLTVACEQSTEDDVGAMNDTDDNLSDSNISNIEVDEEADDDENDDESGDDDDDDDDDGGENSDETEQEVMFNDEQMLALDDQLAKTVRILIKKKSAAGDVKQFVDVGNKLFDLLDAIVMHASSQFYVLHTIVPCLRMISDNPIVKKAPQIGDRAVLFLRNSLAKIKMLPCNDFSDEEFVEILDDVVRIAAHSHSESLLTLSSSVMLFMTKVEIHCKKDCAMICSACGKALEDFMSRRNSRLNSQFFVSLISAFPAEFGWKFFPELVQALGTARSHFLALRVFDIMNALFKHRNVEIPNDENVLNALQGLLSYVKDQINAVVGETDGENKKSRRLVSALLKVCSMSLRATSTGLDFTGEFRCDMVNFLHSVEERFSGTSNTSLGNVVGSILQSHHIEMTVESSLGKKKKKKKRQREAKKNGNEVKSVKRPKKKRKSSQ